MTLWHYSLVVCMTQFIGCSSMGNKNQLLIRAAERGETKEVIRLMEAGADINAKDKEGWTPYLAASSNGQLQAMKILKAAGAKTSAPDFEPSRFDFKPLAESN